MDEEELEELQISDEQSKVLRAGGVQFTRRMMHETQGYGSAANLARLSVEQMQSELAYFKENAEISLQFAGKFDIPLRRETFEGEDLEGTEYPDFMGMAGVFRPYARYDEYGNQYELDTQVPVRNPESPLYHTWTPDNDFPGSDAHRWRNERDKLMYDSLQVPNDTTIPSTVYEQKGKEESFLRRGRDTTAYRNDAGQFARKGYEISREQVERIGKSVRDMIVANYDRLIGFSEGHGGEYTGALKQAVEHSTVSVDQNNDGGFSVRLTLADEPGRPRQQIGSFHPERPSTGTYGPLVFNGRGAVFSQPKFYDSGVAINKKMNYSARTFLHFMMHGEYITAMNVLPSRPFPVYQLDAEQRSELGREFKAMLEEVNRGL